MPTNFHPQYFYQLIYAAIAGHNLGQPDLNRSSSKLEIYAGTQPLDATEDATSAGATLLATVNFDDDTFTAASDGVIRLASPLTFTPSSPGVATWARLYCYNNVNGFVRTMDTEASLTGGGGGLILNSLNLQNGQNYSVDAMALFIPEDHDTVKLSLAFRNAILDVLRGDDVINCAIGQQSTLSIYTGTAPASVYDAPTGTKLAEFVSSSTTTEMWLAPSSAGVATVSSENAWNQATTIADGAPSYFRLVKGPMVMQGLVSTTGADVNVDKSSVVSGETLTITEMSLIAA